ncbi:AAA family ATPase, partial [Chitinophaga sp. 30R24]|uniref:AAA family ATPase n=1 Tax=Chitinophaga sp. 30R24 TaxID=3248838 RepID=UPI003B8F0B25
MKFKKVEIQAFRAYDNVKDGTFDFLNSEDKNADFISIYAPNGFGKTSFYDAVEWGFTNNIQRFLKRTAENIESAKAERSFISEDKEKFKQFILRNKYSESSTQSFVKLYTTISEEPLENRLEEPRNGQPDFKFNKEDTFQGKGFFHDVILSQEWIDAFLKEDNASIRYDKFIAFFGDKNLDSRFKIINGIIKANDTAIANLTKEQKRIKSKLDKDIDTEIISKTNNIISDLNREGEAIDTVESNYTENHFFNLSSQIIQRISTLENQVLKINKQIEVIDQFVSVQSQSINIEQYYQTKDSLSGVELLQVSLNRDKEVLDSFNKLDAQSVNVSEELFRLNEELSNLSALYDLCPAYLSIQSDLDREHEKIKICADQIATYIKTSDNYVLRDRELGRFIAECEQKIALLLSKLNKLSGQKDEKRENEANIKDLQGFILNLEIKNKEIEKEIRENELRSTYLLEIQEMIIKDKYSFPVQGFDEPFIINVSKILESQIQIRDLVVSKSDIEKEISNQRIFDSDLKQLISLGSKIVSQNQLNTCPACGTVQNTVDDLINKITKNSLLSDLESNLLKKKSDIESELAIIRSESESLKKELISAIQEEEQQLLENGRLSEIAKQENEAAVQKMIFEIEGRQANVSKIVSELTNLDFDEFEKLQRSEIIKVELLLSSSRNERADVLRELDIVNQKLTGVRQNEISIKDKIELLRASPNYDRVLTFLQSRHVEFKDASNYLLSEMGIIKQKIDEAIQLENDIKLEIENLRLKLLSIEGVGLEDKIARNSESIAEMRQILLSFESSIALALNIESFGIEKELLISLVNNKKAELQTSELKVTSIMEKYRLLFEQKDLLLRFLNYESLQRSLNSINAQIEFKKGEVRSKLTEERQKVSEYIHHQVENFFYEE